nr:integrase, catalytic region, zinc finger, CCHC-type, peptidase aspartic, catalytic [Tanacetum cinerariifolium]
RAYRVFNKRTRVIMESIHVNFDELPQQASVHNSSDPAPTCQRMASVQISSDPAPKCQTMALEHNSLSPGRKCQENVYHEDKTGTTSNELDLLFSPMFDELLNGSSKVVSKSSAVSTADAPNQRQQPTTPLNTHTTPVPTYGENLEKMKEKGDECIFVGYSTQSRAYRVFNKRTRVIMESIHVNFDELPHMASDQISSYLAPECQTMAFNHDSLSPAIQCKANVPQADRTVTTLNEPNLLFSPMFDELLNGSSKVVSKSSVLSAANALNQRQHHTTPLNNHTTPAPTCQVPTFAPTVISSENINQAETYAENDQVADDEFINILSTPVQDQG